MICKFPSLFYFLYSDDISLLLFFYILASCLIALFIFLPNWCLLYGFFSFFQTYIHGKKEVVSMCSNLSWELLQLTEIQPSFFSKLSREKFLKILYFISLGSMLYTLAHQISLKESQTIHTC